MTTKNKPGHERLAYSTAEVADLLGMDRTTVYRHCTAGIIRSVHIGGRVLVPAHELDRLLELPNT